MRRKDIVIIGTGGCARELQWLLLDNDRLSEDGDRWNIRGFVEPAAKEGDTVNGLPVLSEEWLFQQKGLCVALGIGEVKTREKVVAKLTENGTDLIFPAIISKRAAVSEFSRIEEGCVICAGAVVSCNVELGAFSMVNFGSVVAHDSRIGRFCQINPGTNISGGVTLEDSVQIGTGVKIIPGISVGSHAVLGAGSVVLKNISPNSTVFGNPARVIGNG